MQPNSTSIDSCNGTSSHSLSANYFPMLLALFFGSGCAALMYEVVWFQMLQLVIGSSAVSLGVLLGTYMGGMLLGSIALPRLITPKWHPLRVYAFLELGIGLFGLLILFSMPLLDKIYLSFVGYGFAGILLRGIICAVSLLAPTALMGASLPAIARWIEMTPKGVSWLGYLYGGNLAGAIAGCLMAGFYLLRVYDMATATFVAVAINMFIALTGIAVTRGMRYERPEEVPAQGNAIRVSRFWVVYVVIAFSGLTALSAEVVWTRLLSLILGGTVYTFSIILAVFLTGLGLGSGIGSFLSRVSSRPGAVLGLCQLLLTAAIAWASFAISGSLPYWPVNPALSSSPWFSFQLDLVRCLWAVLPAAVIWGASFPLAIAAVASRSQEPGRLMGEIYAANTLGAIIGAIGFSLLVIPWLGTQDAQRLMIVLSGISALFMFAWFPQPARKVSPILRTAAAAGCIGAVIWFTWSVPPVNWEMIAYGPYLPTWTSRLAPEITLEQDVPTDQGEPDIFCIYEGEGMNESVVVTKLRSGVVNFHSTGKVQASSHPDDMRLQRMLGHIPALAIGNPKTALVIGCGAGVTAGTFVLYPSIQRIVICDIERLVPACVAPKFAKENYGVVTDPRTEVVSDDGRHFIHTTREKFDIITSDPIDPWMKGCAALYSEEFYAMCREHLNPGGIVTIWLPFYNSDPETVKSLVATFFKVFPEGTIWCNNSEGKGYDAVLLGQAGPSHIDMQEMQARLADEDFAPVAQSLDQVGFPSAVDLFATYAGDAPHLQKWLAGAQINSDRNLRLQYLAGMGVNFTLSGEIVADMFQYRAYPEELFSGPVDTIQQLRDKIESKPNE